MVYQVLARKFRPCDFTQVASQAATITVLQNSLDSKKLHHAYLFTGTRGVGKTTIARILAKSLVCEQGISSRPCNVCELCQSVTNGNCIDVIEIDAASRTKVEDTRALLDNLAYAPNIARFKIYIIDEVHMLSTHSFNALLKSLEEPPAHVKFLLATTDPQKLPITILSRCLQFKLKMFTTSDITEQLEKILSIENKLFEKSALLQLAIAARGSMRDALSLLEQVLAFGEQSDQITQIDVCKVLGIPDSIRLINLLMAVIQSNLDGVISIINNFFEDNYDLSIILQEIQVMLKNITILQLAPNALPNDIIINKELLLKLANIASLEEIQLYYDIAVNGFKNLAFTPDPKVGFEMILLRMVAFRPVKIAENQCVTPSLLYVEEQSSKNETIKKENITNVISNNVSNINKNNITEKINPENHNNLDRSNVCDIVSKLNISGLTKELAENSVFEEIGDNKIKLIIDENQKILVTKRNIENLQEAFSKYFVKEMKIKVELENFQKNSNLIQHTIKWQQQQKLQNFVDNDQGLQQLIANFDGKIEEIETLDL